MTIQFKFEIKMKKKKEGKKWERITQNWIRIRD